TAPLRGKASRRSHVGTILLLATPSHESEQHNSQESEQTYSHRGFLSVANLGEIHHDAIEPTRGGNEVGIGLGSGSDALAKAPHRTVAHTELDDAGVLAIEFKKARTRCARRTISRRQRPGTDPRGSELTRADLEIVQPLTEQQRVTAAIGGRQLLQADMGAIAKNARIAIDGTVVNLSAIAGDADIAGPAQIAAALGHAEAAHEEIEARGGSEGVRQNVGLTGV